ncbi:hypothetical protein BHE74_00035133 [Ensete ventricosum]|nr:hypothetical protein BHE74_00035133 [Ensete ventricosum]
MSSPANAVVISSDQAMKRTQHCSSRVFALTASEEGFTYDDDRTERRGKEADLSSKEEYVIYELCLCTPMASCPAQSSGHPQVTMIGSRVFGPQEMLAVDRVLPS